MSRDLFEDLTPVERVPGLLKGHFSSPGPEINSERVSLDEARGRILGRDICAPMDVPGFSRSTVDGYAVRAFDTRGASESFPACLEVSGEVKMGSSPGMSLRRGQAVEIPTGGMLPDGADAVVMLEYTQRHLAEEIEVLGPVTRGENVIRSDEDLAAGQKIMTRGTYLRSSHLGVLAGVGVKSVFVYCKPEVVVFSTGEEVIPPSQSRGAAEIYDMNGPMLTASLRRDGASPAYGGILGDSHREVKEAVTEALDAAQMVIISGGSSVGQRDITSRVIEECGPPGIILHGVAMRPGKPTIFGATPEGRALVGLPGHPVSAQVVYTVLVRDLLFCLAGRRRPVAEPAVRARLGRSLVATSGRVEYVRVRLKEEEDGLVAHPILGKSGLLSTLARADGLVELKPVRRGIDAGESVEVMLLAE